MAKRTAKKNPDEQQSISPDVVPDPSVDDAADLSSDGDSGPDVPDGEDEPENENAPDGENADAETSPPVIQLRLCSCGEEMDIVKRTLKRRFDVKNKVTYFDALQCLCPNCRRVKEFEA
jgi:hypothetical protein